MPDYALMNQCLYEGKAKEVGEMTQAALDEGRPVQEISNTTSSTFPKCSSPHAR